MRSEDVVVLKFDQEELAVLILEGMTDALRPVELSAHECLAMADQIVVARAMRAAEATYNHFVAELNRQGVPAQNVRLQ